MTNPNELGGAEEANTKKDNKNLYAQLASDYSREKLKESDGRSQYLQALEGANSVSTEMLADIKKFAERDSQGKYDGVEITADKISIGALKREATGYFASIANNKRSVKDVILQEYDLSEDDLSAKVDLSLKGLSEKQLKDLHQNETNRKRFMIQQFGASNLPQEKSIANFLKDMNLEEMYNRVNPDSEIQFYDLVQKVKSGKTLDDMDVEMLLTSGIYTQSEKQKLIAKLLPSITLAKAKQLNLIETRHAADLKDDYIRSVDPELHRGSVREISSSIADEDIVISTDKFTGLKKNVDKMIDNPSIFNDFIEKYNSHVSQLRENIEGKEIRKASDFVSLIGEYPMVQGAEKFTKGSVIEISQTQKTEDGSTKQIKLYGKIVSLGDDGSFSYIEKGHDKYDSAQTATKNQSYNSFLEYIGKGNPQTGVKPNSVSVYSDTEFDALLASGKVPEYNGDTLRLKSKDQIQADIENMSRDINGTQEALRAKEVQMRNDLSKQKKPKLSQSEIQQKIDADPWVQKYRSDLERMKQEQYEKTESLDHLESNNFETLKAKIDEIDKEGDKFGLEAGTTFKTKTGDIYTITHEPSKAGSEIHITSLAGPESYSFEEFFRGFKQQETKRVNKQASDFASLVDTIKTDGGEDSGWTKFSFKDGKIQKDDSQKNITYDYLASKSSEELIKIQDISGNRVTVSFGKLHSKGKRNKDGELVKGPDKKSIKDETFSIENREYVVTLGFLEEYIKEHKLDPRGLQDNQEVVADEKGIDPMNKKTHFWSAFFHNRATIADAVKGGTLFFEQMKEAFQMGSDEKANQFALKYMGSVLSEDMKRDMQSRLEQKQKKSMDDYLERLKGVASDVAIKMIDKWLHDKYAPDYLHEAAVVFMLEKYGVLNAKGLQKYEGQYVWYQALGGEPNDEFFKSVKEEKESQNLPFTEELLVYLFLKQQCKPNGFKGKKRRSKLHKEVKKHRATGKDEEYETGKRDGNDERTLDGRVNGGVEEMLSNNYPNMVGWLEVAINKGGPMHLMNKIPFLAAFSGVAYNFEEKTTDQLKNFPGGTRLLMMLRFFSYHSDLDLLNKTILGISHTLERRGDTKHAGMGKQAQVLFDQLRSPGGGVASKIKKTEVFYDQYGEELTNILYMLNTGKVDDTTNKLIFFEKDNPENEYSETFSKYYKNLHDFVDADTSFEDEGLMSDPFKGAGTSGIEMHKFAEQQIGTRQGQFKKHTSGPIGWSEIQHELEAIPKRQYDIDPVKNKEMHMKLLSDNLQRFISGIMLSVGTNARELGGYNAEIGPFNKLNKWGIDMTRFNETSDFSVHGLLHAKGDVKRLVDEFSNQIIQTETIGADFTHLIVNEMGPNAKGGSDSNAISIENSVSNTRKKVSETTTRSPGLNPDDYYGEE